MISCKSLGGSSSLKFSLSSRDFIVIVILVFLAIHPINFLVQPIYTFFCKCLKNQSFSRKRTNSRFLNASLNSLPLPLCSCVNTVLFKKILTKDHQFHSFKKILLQELACYGINGQIKVFDVMPKYNWLFGLITGFYMFELYLCRCSMTYYTGCRDQAFSRRNISIKDFRLFLHSYLYHHFNHFQFSVLKSSKATSFLTEILKIFKV